MVHSRSVLKAVVVVGVAASSVLAVPLPPPGAEDGAAPAPRLPSSSLDRQKSDSQEFSNESNRQGSPQSGPTMSNYIENAAQHDANPKVGSTQARRSRYMRFMGAKPPEHWAALSSSTESLSDPNEPSQGGPPQRSQRVSTSASFPQKDSREDGDSGSKAPSNASGSTVSKTKRGLDIVEDDEGPHAVEVEMIEEDYSHSHDENDGTAFARRLFARASDTEEDPDLPGPSSESQSPGGSLATPDLTTSNRIGSAASYGTSRITVGDILDPYSLEHSEGYKTGNSIDKATSFDESRVEVGTRLNRSFMRPQYPTNPTDNDSRGGPGVAPVQMNPTFQAGAPPRPLRERVPTGAEDPPKPASVRSVSTSASVPSQPATDETQNQRKVQGSSPSRKTPKRGTSQTTSGDGDSSESKGSGPKNKRGLDIVEDDEEPHAAEVEMIEEDYSHSHDENDETAFAPRLFARTGDTVEDPPESSNESGPPEPPTSNRFNNAVPEGESTLTVDRTSVYSRVARYNLHNGMKVDRTATTSRQATINFVEFNRPQGPGTNSIQPKPFSSTAVPPLGNLRGSQAVVPVQMNTMSRSSQQEGPPKPASVSVFTSASVSSQPDLSFDGTRTGKVWKSSPSRRRTAKQVASQTTEEDGGSGSKSSGSKNKRGLDIVEDDEEPHAAEVEMIEDYSHPHDKNDETAFAPRLFARTSDSEGDPDSPGASSRSESPPGSPPRPGFTTSKQPDSTDSELSDEDLFGTLSRGGPHRPVQEMKTDEDPFGSFRGGPGRPVQKMNPTSSSRMDPLKHSQKVPSSAGPQEGPPKPASVQDVPSNSASVSQQVPSSLDETQPRHSTKATRTSNMPGDSGSKGRPTGGGSETKTVTKREPDIVEDDEKPCLEEIEMGYSHPHRDEATQVKEGGSRPYHHTHDDDEVEVELEESFHDPHDRGIEVDSEFIEGPFHPPRPQPQPRLPLPLHPPQALDRVELEAIEIEIEDLPHSTIPLHREPDHRTQVVEVVHDQAMPPPVPMLIPGPPVEHHEPEMFKPMGSMPPEPAKDEVEITSVEVVEEPSIGRPVLPYGADLD
ncbi:hypothetical protein F5880DRAFT_1607324 [Lentinula raphanica]|nr:hypothetical protein F5880DRAFT_1607324 [Lentinula raphanica]